jgi:ubiquinone/menaquinone biosynthesis C-methylase UbiE
MTNPAETYESYMVPVLFAPWASRLLQSARAKAGERALDVGCGTGIVARRVAREVGSNGKVAALDLSGGMLAVARTAAAREGVAVEWHEGRAERLPFPDASFDLVLCQFALMFFADRPAALAEMRRVLMQGPAANGSRVALSVFRGLDLHPFYGALHEAIQRRLGLSGVQDIFAFPDPEALRRLCAAAGFANIALETVSMTARFPNPEAFLAGEIDVDTAAIPSMQHLDAAARREVTAALERDMAGHLREAIKDGHVVLPFHVLIASASPVAA